MRYEFSEAEKSLEKLDEGIYLEHLTCPKEELPIEEIPAVYGMPEQDEKLWQKGSSAISDSIMCEKYALEALEGSALTEEQMISESAKRGFFDREYGCALSEVGRYAECLGYSVTREQELTVRDICEALDNNEKVICAVSSISLFHPALSDMPGLSADSFIEVIGINESVPGKRRVIANLPGADRGGVSCDLDAFLPAWEKSGRFAVIINKSG